MRHWEFRFMQLNKPINNVITNFFIFFQFFHKNIRCYQQKKNISYVFFLQKFTKSQITNYQ